MNVVNLQILVGISRSVVRGMIGNVKVIMYPVIGVIVNLNSVKDAIRTDMIDSITIAAVVARLSASVNRASVKLHEGTVRIREDHDPVRIIPDLAIIELDMIYSCSRSSS